MVMFGLTIYRLIKWRGLTREVSRARRSRIRHSSEKLSQSRYAASKTGPLYTAEMKRYSHPCQLIQLLLILRREQVLHTLHPISTRPSGLLHPASLTSTVVHHIVALAEEFVTP